MRINELNTQQKRYRLDQWRRILTARRVKQWNWVLTETMGPRDPFTTIKEERTETSVKDVLGMFILSPYIEVDESLEFPLIFTFP